MAIIELIFEVLVEILMCCSGKTAIIIILGIITVVAIVAICVCTGTPVQKLT
jgi:hypothetical protein